MGKSIRLFIASLAGLAFLAAWAGVVIAYITEQDVATFTIAVTAAAIATEILIWVGAFVFGWSMFANRKALWRRLTGRTAEQDA